MSTTVPSAITFPVNPLDRMTFYSDESFKRRHIEGILESYNSNYDVLSELLQNSVDAVEDASLLGLGAPFAIEVTLNLKDNYVSVLDTGIGMSAAEIVHVCVPHASLKPHPGLTEKRGKRAPYRGYKGVGLTFLAYGTDDIEIHAKRDGKTTKTRMQYGRAWAEGRRAEGAVLIETTAVSPLEKYDRGTFVRVQFSQHTRPRSLSRLGSTIAAWDAILRTKTAIGQILLERDPVVKLSVKLTLVTEQGPESRDIKPEFLYPHSVVRPHAFRFLDLPKYYKIHSEHSEPPIEKRRQDGIYLVWDTEKIQTELTSEQETTYAEELKAYTPVVYGFLPYQGAVWKELNELVTGKSRGALGPGLMIGVNRQRMTDVVEIDATRYEVFSRNVFVLVHFDHARPDLGRKTLQEEVTTLAQKIGDRVVQYLAKQRAFLRPSGEAPTADKRDVERDHDDWQFNVRSHAEKSPLHIPPISYVSTPLVEQDVVGLFHQLSTLGIFPGLKIFATSQSKTYDCLIQFQADRDAKRLIYDGPAGKNPLGVSPYVLGSKDQFRSAMLTLEFKNNIDGLIDDVESENRKQFNQIDVCVCWGQIGATFKGYELQEITDHNMDQRAFPGVTHILRKDGDAHIMQVVMLATVVALINSGRLSLA
jgi:hypothetical protein